jgi:DNA-binding FadR family transcriptional regulator
LSTFPTSRGAGARLPPLKAQSKSRRETSRGRTSIGGGRGVNLTYRIVEDLGIAIVTGKYNEANPFPVEADLCRQYGVSRSILREAVKMLTAKDLLGARPRHGTWVQPEDTWNLLDPDVLRWLLERKLSFSLLIELNEIRLAVEPIAAGLAAVDADPVQKAAIMTAIDRMVAAESGADDPLASDIAFHVGVMRAANNRFYSQLCDVIETALRFSIRTTNYFKGVKLASVADHKLVADAILSGDAPAAEKALRVLIQEALDLILGASAGGKPPSLPRK